jgi:hypothetical protein
MSNELITRNLGEFIINELKMSSRFRIISPFISNEIVEMLINFISQTKFELITRFNETDFITGVSDIRGIETLFEKGVNIYGVENLHSKVYLFDSSAIVTSGNMTNGGFRNNHECGILTRDIDIVNDLNKYFELLSKSKLLDKYLLIQMKNNVNYFRADYTKQTIVGAINHGTRVDFELSKFFFVNIGYITKGKIRKERNWDDFRNYNFISAGQGLNYSKPLYKLMPGNVVFAYVSNLGENGGYIGVGIVKESAVKVNEFKHEGKPLLHYMKKLKGDIFKNSHDANLSEYLVKIDWISNRDLDKGFKAEGKYFVHRQGLCSMKNQIDTVEWLLHNFKISKEKLPL